MKLPQSNIILFCLVLAFLVFITLRGELPQYLSVLFSTQGQAGSGTGAGTASGGAVDNAATKAIGSALGEVGSFVDQNTGSDVLGRAATSLRSVLPNFLGGI